MTSQIR